MSSVGTDPVSSAQSGDSGRSTGSTGESDVLDQSSIGVSDQDAFLGGSLSGDSKSTKSHILGLCRDLSGLAKNVHFLHGSHRMDVLCRSDLRRFSESVSEIRSFYDEKVSSCSFGVSLYCFSVGLCVLIWRAYLQCYCLW